MSSDDTFKNAAIGAVASIVLFFLPFSPALGGAVAGYLQGPDTDEGLRVGGLSGALAAIPLALLFVLGVAFFAIVGAGRAALGFFVLFFVVLAIALVYGVVLGALGGLLGAYLNDEFRGSDGTTVERIRTERVRTGSEPTSERTEFDEPLDREEPVGREDVGDEDDRQR